MFLFLRNIFETSRIGRNSLITSLAMSKTPMMKQYDKAKAECGDALLFFRMGDFYELFYEDAEKASKVLGLTLTSRDKGPNAIAMAGFPHHQLDNYMPKLIKLGFRVAVCEQVEDPKAAKGLVRREISQVVSPGTVTDGAMLDPAESNYLASLVSADTKKKKTESADMVGLSWIELSTGVFRTAVVAQREAADILTRLSVSEVLVEESEQDSMRTLCGKAMVTTRPMWAFAYKKTHDSLLDQFSVATLEGFGLSESERPAIRAAGSIIQYLHEVKSGSLDHVDQIHPVHQNSFVEIDQATWRSLEVSRTIRTGAREGSLLHVIDRCATPMGSRLLGSWLTCPLTDLPAIQERQEAVAEFVDRAELRNDVRAAMKSIYDLQRLVSRVTTGRASPRDLSSISKTLAALPALKAKLVGRKSKWLQNLECNLDLCADLRSELERALVDPCPAQLRDGGFIQDGYNEKLDSFRQLANGGKQWIANYQKTICEKTGIPSLKVGFNKVFGYYLEVTNTHKDKVPAEFIRKQTLKNAERYITPELKEYEEKVLSADEKSQELELELFNGLRELARANTTRLKANAEIIATLDVVAGLAHLAATQSYCRPEVTEERALSIVEGRHPVLDIIEPTGAFVPNDTVIDDAKGFVHLITGPNMAGKSTYIRQVALITLLAQIGSYVPAKSATIGIVDRIFARIGASDELTRGQSTFMVEMTETARILNTATAKSLVILDEIGRGTSTYDGVSLAWSIVEFIHDHVCCRTLFATHYHELTELETTFSGVKNYNVSVQEWDEKIVFLHKIIAGAADRSYGIQVAKLAGVPDWVNRRAEQILKKLESSNQTEENREAIKQASDGSDGSSGMQLTLFEVVDHPLVDKIKNLNPDQLTPIEALNLISEIKTEL